MRFKTVFITGTDTGVGKTTVSCGLAAALRRNRLTVGVFKPAETGCDGGPDAPRVPADAAQLRFFAESPLGLRAICPYSLREPLAPWVAAQRENVTIDFEELVACQETIAAAYDVTLMEGAGGLLVPITATQTLADLAIRLDSPVLIVVGSRLGAINHALLTIRQARSMGLHVLGYILNFLGAEADVAAQTNAAVLAQWVGAPLGVVPYLGSVVSTAAERARLAELFSKCVQLDALLVPA